jgi:hypothetical protein
VYVNDIRIRAGDKASSIRDLSAELQRHNVGGITFHLPLDGPAVRALIGAVGGAPAAREPRNALVRALQAAGLSGLELQGRFRFRMAAEGDQERPDPHAFLSRALAATDEAFQNLAAGRVPNPLPLRRIVTELLERGVADEQLWADPADVPPHALHQLRVAQLALLVGRDLGLSPNLMQDLGVAALYHDCGYAAEAPPPERWALVQARPAVRLPAAAQPRGEGARVLATAAPPRHDRLRPGLFGRILRVAEDYDTLARRSGKLSPTLALAAMLKWAGTRYDAVVLQLLINALGAYPPGSLLKLEDGRVVRSATPARSPETFATPLARCLRLADGSPAPDDLPLVDLRGAGPVHLLRGLP